ncbi:cyclic nucleotide-binding domain-containing protein [Bradyrhizobium genosp. L]|uniref:cyclic nucleotide-binding domain-containing protein n=1 Tax=Bradyrhizobium genosp. L TaxID=83637 RepID=UPI0018A27ED7|nr:cyclic nucleotide-binding domain-containing protein [Bradyrhizobium genosp. L]QPF85531.1 cyclic nucleotide-binding domain-containing protein [Bradyrhizobium genosp. L]
MTSLYQLGMASLLGLVTTSSSLIGAAIGLHLSISKRLLAFAAGSLISALAIELAYEGAQSLHHQNFDAHGAWAFISAGFATGAIIYWSTSLFLEKKGAAIRYVTQFREFALARKHADNSERIKLLSKSGLMCHLPAEEIEPILAVIGDHQMKAGEILFRAGDPGDALYIVAKGRVEVLKGDAPGDGAPLAVLGAGAVFGEMALLSGEPRTATIRAAEDTKLLAIAKADFEQLLARDDQLAAAAQRISHQRAISNLSAKGANAALWAKVASRSLDLHRHETGKLLTETASGAGMAIVLGNILDTIPGCLVIGAKFTSFGNLSLTLMLGMFLGGIPEAAASAAMLTKAGYRPARIYGLWSLVLLAGLLAAVAGKAFIGSSEAIAAVFAQAVAGGAVLALVAHAMIPVALDEGGSLVVLPTVGGFLFALYLALVESLV